MSRAEYCNRRTPQVRVEIRREGDTAYVAMLSNLLVNKRVEVSFQYSTEFSDYEILSDFSMVGWLITRCPFNLGPDWFLTINEGDK